MHNQSGKIIAIVGAPRSGKSFLANLLARHYIKSRVFLEGEEPDFPERIKEDIQKNIRPLERALWFRNKSVEKHFLALKHKEKGETVILDTFWASYQLYIDALTEGFKNNILKELAKIDNETLNYPDITIFLNTTESGIKKFIELGGRQFDKAEDFIVNQALPVNKLHQEFFINNKNLPGKIIVIQREELDFAKKEDFDKLIALIEE